MDKEKNPQQQGTQPQKPGQTPAPVWEQPEKEKEKSGQQGGQRPGQPGSGGQPGAGQKSGTGQQSGGQGGQNR